MSLGVFISRDTYKGSVCSSITHNLYSYTGNNPVNFIDPTGHMMDMIDYQPGGRSGSTGGGVDPNTGKGSSQTTQPGIIDNNGIDLLDSLLLDKYHNHEDVKCQEMYQEMVMFYVTRNHNVPDLTDEIYDILYSNSQQVIKEIGKYGYIDAFLMWYNRVNHKGKWDTKLQTSYLDKYDTFLFEGVVMDVSDFGNLNYAVTGMEFFSAVPFVLFAGGNLAAGTAEDPTIYQTYSIYTGGDDMRDQLIINYGIQLYRLKFQ